MLCSSTGLGFDQAKHGTQDETENNCEVPGQSVERGWHLPTPSTGRTDKDSRVPNLSAGMSPGVKQEVSEPGGGILKRNQNCSISSGRLVITSSAGQVCQTRRRQEQEVLLSSGSQLLSLCLVFWVLVCILLVVWFLRLELHSSERCLCEGERKLWEEASNILKIRDFLSQCQISAELW